MNSKKTVLQPKLIFLVDGIGAVLTTCFLFILSLFEPFFGMPRYILYLLMIPAGLLAICSLSRYRRPGVNWRWHLRFIAIANLLYCLVTACLVINFFEQLTGWGIAYFIVEMMIVVILAVFELRISGNNS
ncbi:MAG: hypothetical protein KIT80_16005 [Chitinophagaceae bacterium]|nr:hypothetical protein [Chitinophagaceae bacterium]MCW5928421.1 hypothetical protein [Chitinophagaceae bacterium]